MPHLKALLLGFVSPSKESATTSPSYSACPKSFFILVTKSWVTTPAGCDRHWLYSLLPQRIEVTCPEDDFSYDFREMDDNVEVFLTRLLILIVLSRWLFHFCRDLGPHGNLAVSALRLKIWVRGILYHLTWFSSFFTQKEDLMTCLCLLRPSIVHSELHVLSTLIFVSALWIRFC